MRSHWQWLVVTAALAAASAVGCKKQQPAAEPSEHQTASPAEQDDAFGRLTVAQVASHIKDAAAGKMKLAVYDNNARSRYDKSHVAGAAWVKFDEVSAADLPADKDTTLVFYCANEH